MHRIILFVLIICSFSACKKEESVNEFLNIGDDLELSLSQNVDASGPYYQLKISTIDSISCTNSTIVSSSYYNQDRLIISLEGIADNECDEGQAKASTEEKLSDLTTELPFSISIKDVLKTTGRVTRNDAQARLFLENDNGIILKNNIVLPIKPNTFFGVIESDNNSDIIEFIILLNEHTNQDFVYNQGNYGLFTVNTFGIVNFTDFIKTKNVSNTFYVEYKDWKALQTALQLYLQNNTDVKISARNCYDEKIEN